MTLPLYVFWTFDSTSQTAHVTQTSIDDKHHSKAKTYAQNNLVLSAWSRGKPLPSSGCTRLTDFFSSKPKPLSKVYVITVNESEQGEWDATELIVVPCLKDVHDYVESRFQEFVENRCGLCGSDDTQAEYERVLDDLTKDHATSFGECMRDYEISYSSIDVTVV